MKPVTIAIWSFRILVGCWCSSLYTWPVRMIIRLNSYHSKARLSNW